MGSFLRRKTWSGVRRRALAVALACAALAAPLAAEAQRPAGDPSRCGDPVRAEQLERAMTDLQGAQFLVNIYGKYVRDILAMGPADLRQASINLSRAIDREQAALRLDPGASRAGLRELTARRDLVLENMLNIEIGARTDPERNSYAPLAQKAKSDLELAHRIYVQALAACGQAPGGAGAPPITQNIQPEAYSSTPVLTNRPPGAVAAPPVASTGNSAGGRIRFKPMSQQDAQQMADNVAPNGAVAGPPAGAPDGAAADMSSWGGAYSDGQQTTYNVWPAGAYLSLAGGSSVGGRTTLLDWNDCRVWGSGVTCSMKGEVRNPNDGVAITGTVTAVRSNGTISGTYTISTVNVLWGRTNNIAPGQSIGFRYLPY